MPCYIELAHGPTREEFELWIKLGFTGSWERYSAIKSKNEGSVTFICGDLGDHCADCMGIGEYLCDFPVGDGKTCDRPMCSVHASEIGHEIHYCSGHLRMWLEFKDSGGVAAELANVIAFPKPR